MLLKDKKDGFSCTTEGIAVSSGPEAIQQNLLGYMPGTYTMIKDKEGHLVVKYRESGGGLELGVIPVAGSNTYWHRVDPYVAESPAERQHKITALEARYEFTDRGTVIDSSTGLEWTQADNGSEIYWNEAKQWCNGRGAGWRLPTVEELQAIYDSSGTLSTPCGSKTCKVSPKFQFSGWWFWTSDLNGSSNVFTVILYDGNRYPNYGNKKAKYSALCVTRP